MRQGFSWQVRERMRERGAGEGRWKGEGRWREKGRKRERAREAQREVFPSYHHLGSYESSG